MNKIIFLILFIIWCMVYLISFPVSLVLKGLLFIHSLIMNKMKQYAEKVDNE